MGKGGRGRGDWGRGLGIGDWGCNIGWSTAITAVEVIVVEHCWESAALACFPNICIKALSRDRGGSKTGKGASSTGAWELGIGYWTAGGIQLQSPLPIVLWVGRAAVGAANIAVQESRAHKTYWVLLYVICMYEVLSVDWCL